MLNTDLSRILRSPETQRALRAPCKKIHRSPKVEPTGKPENHVEAKPTCRDHAPEPVLHQVKNHQLQVDEAAAALEAQSGEKGLPGKKPAAGKEGKKAVGATKQKTPLVGKKKKPAAEKKPAEKKPTTEEKRPVAETYICLFHKGQVTWTADLE